MCSQAEQRPSQETQVAAPNIKCPYPCMQIFFFHLFFDFFFFEAESLRWPLIFVNPSTWVRKQGYQDFKAIVSCRMSFGTTQGCMRPCLNRTQYDRSGELSPWFRAGMAHAGDPSHPSLVGSIHVGWLITASNSRSKRPAIMAGNTAPGASRILGSQTCTNADFLCRL